MSKVSVTKEKLDTLAEAVGAKSGESIPLTIDEMTSAVLSIQEINNQSKTVTPTKSTQQVVPDSGYTGLNSVTVNAMNIQPLSVSSSLNKQVFNTPSVNGYSPVTVYPTPLIYTAMEYTPAPVQQSSYFPSEYYLIEDLNFETGSYEDAVEYNIVEGTPIYIEYAARSESTQGDIAPIIRESFSWTDSGSAIYENSYFSMQFIPGAELDSPASYQLTVFDGCSVTLSCKAKYAGIAHIEILGDEDLVSENIKKDVDIFGITGTYEPILTTKTITPSIDVQVVQPVNTVVLQSADVILSKSDEASGTLSKVHGMDLSALVVGKTYRIVGTLKQIKYAQYTTTTTYSVNNEYKWQALGPNEHGFVISDETLNAFSQVKITSLAFSAYKSSGDYSLTFSGFSIFISEPVGFSQVTVEGAALTEKTVTPSKDTQMVSANGTLLSYDSPASTGYTYTFETDYVFKKNTRYKVFGSMYQQIGTSGVKDTYDIPEQIVAMESATYAGIGGYTRITLAKEGSSSIDVHMDLRSSDSSSSTFSSILITKSSGSSALCGFNLLVEELPDIYLGGHRASDTSGTESFTCDFSSIDVGDQIFIKGYAGYPDGQSSWTDDVNETVAYNGTDIVITPPHITSKYESITIKPNLASNNVTVKSVNNSLTYELVLYKKVFSQGPIGLSKVVVDPIPSEYIIPEGTLEVTQNGTVDVTQYASATVSVPSSAPTLQSKTVTPTESQQTVSPDSGYDALSSVTVDAISSTYVGTGITRNPTPTASGGTVTIPSGYYETSVLKSVDTATAGTISVAVNASGLVTATATSPAGYFTGGTKTATMQLSTQADATIIPSEEEQVLSTSGKYMLGDITIEAIETESATAVSNGTVYPSTGKYLSQVTVAVPSDIHNQNKEITPTESAQTVSADVGYSGLGTVTVKAISQTYVGSAVPKNPTPTINGKTVTVPVGYYNTQQTVTIGSEYIVPTGTTTITSNGTYNVTTYASANINIPSDIHNQAKTVTPTESIQTISADSGYSGLSTVTVEAISSEYVGSGVTTRSSADMIKGVSGNYFRVTAPAGYYADNGVVNIAKYTAPTPSVSLDSSTGVITTTARIANSGYYDISSMSASLSLTTQTGTTITPTATSQTAVAQYRWTTGTITVAAVPTDTNNSFSANGTYTPASGKWFDSVTVAVPSDINNQNKTVTPTESVQTISADSGYSGLGTVTVSNIPNNYVGSAIQTRSLSDIQSVTWTYSHNSTYPYVSHTMSIPAGYYPNGSTGYGYTLILNDIRDLPKQGATTITPTTTQQTAVSKWTWTTGDIIVDAIPVSTISNAALNISTVTEATNDYGVEAEITIPAGYYNTTTLSALISDVLPIPATAAVVSQILSGYEAYDYQGKLLAGTMTNRAAWNATLNDTITSTTIPAGYHNGSGTVSHTTVNIPDPTFSMNNSTGVITASGTWTKGFTTDNSYSNTYSLTTQAGKTVTPTESAQTAVAANRWTTGTITVAAIPNDYVGSGITTRTSLNMSANTVTASVGYYPNAVTVTVTAMTLPTSAVTTSSGTAKATITRSTATRYINIPVGYNNTAAHYVISAVANGTVVPPTTITGSQATVTAGTNVLTFSKSISVTPNVTTAGYISAGTASNVTVTLSAAITTKAGATITPGTTNQTIAGGTYLTGTQTIAGDADLVAGNIKTGVNIFGVTGTYAGLDTSDATAIAGDIVLGETAYVDGEKITGTLVVQDYYTGTTAPSNSLGQNGDIYLRGGSL